MYTLLEKTLFDHFSVSFPVENSLSIVIGPNGSYKTKTLELLFEYFLERNENVLFFPDENRQFFLTEEDIEKVVHYKDIKSKFSIVEKHELDLSLLKPESFYGKVITSGYLQLANIVCSILLQEEPTVVIIDMPERNLSIAWQNNLINDLLSLPNVKKLIVATHSPSILSSHWGNCIKIEDCVSLLTNLD